MDFPIKSVSNLDKLSHSVKWQYFEKLVAFIFEQNDFDIELGKILKFEGGKRQVDIVAKKAGNFYVVECKKWTHRQRVAALSGASKRHTERTEIYGFINNCRAVPLIVTLNDDDVKRVNDVQVVPIMKLDWFLNNHEGLE